MLIILLLVFFSSCDETHSESSSSSFSSWLLMKHVYYYDSLSECQALSEPNAYTDGSVYYSGCHSDFPSMGVSLEADCTDDIMTLTFYNESTDCTGISDNTALDFGSYQETTGCMESVKDEVYIHAACTADVVTDVTHFHSYSSYLAVDDSVETCPSGREVKNYILREKSCITYSDDTSQSYICNSEGMLVGHWNGTDCGDGDGMKSEETVTAACNDLGTLFSRLNECAAEIDTDTDGSNLLQFIGLVVLVLVFY